MKLFIATFKCLLIWLAVFGTLTLLSSVILRVKFGDAVSMAKPDYEYVIAPDELKRVDHYRIERGKYVVGAFIVSLLILPTAVALRYVELKANEVIIK